MPQKFVPILPFCVLSGTPPRLPCRRTHAAIKLKPAVDKTADKSFIPGSWRDKYFSDPTETETSIKDETIVAPDIDVIHRYIAYGSVGASTVRGLRTKGVVDSAREALRDVNLKPYGDATAKSFRKTLDSDTENVRRALPAGVRYWGVARKVLNIFLRGSLYNTYLTAHFGLA